MSYPLDKYRYYVAGNKVIAVSSYAKQPVRGVAVCHPDDTFDLELGKRIAAAKCNEKVAQKRMYRAQDKALAAGLALAKAQEEYNRMKDYYQDAYLAYNEAAMETDKICGKLN